MKKLLYTMKNKVLLYFDQIKWRKINKHNFTTLENRVPLNVVKVGKYTYGKLNIHYYKTNEESLSIGNFCSIADDVHFFLGGGHDYRNLLSYPFKNYMSNHKIKESISKGALVIDDDVWIGYRAVVLSGVHIGQGAVIGTGAIVAKDVPPYAIYAGNRIISYRFSEDIIQKMMQRDLGKLTFDAVSRNVENFYTHVDQRNIDSILQTFDNLLEEQIDG